MGQAAPTEVRRFTEAGLDRDDGDEVFEAGEVVGVTCVQRGVMGVSSGGDEEIHDAAPRLSSSDDDGCSEPSVADRYGVVDGQGVEVLLQNAEAPQTFGACLR